MQTEKEMRGWQSERKGRGNKTEEKMMIKEKSGESEGQERLHEEKLSHRSRPFICLSYALFNDAPNSTAESQF